METFNINLTKLSAQFVHPKTVNRPRLLDKLNEGFGEGRRVTLISAPAGYGKTTLAVEWLKSLNYPFAWLSLDSNDNDPARFFSYLIASIQMNVDKNIGVSAGNLLGSYNMLPKEMIIDLLIKDISLSGQFIMVFEDLHVIRSPAVNEMIQYMADTQPSNMHLMLITREDPLIRIPKLRAQRKITEIRASDLRFNCEEILQFYNLIDIHLTQSAASDIESRTEGWAAGLQLAGISMQDQDKDAVDRFIRSFSGSHRHIIDYLVDEVLSKQSDDVRDFLCRTSILGRFSASLCDAVTGRGDSKDILLYLEKNNLFLIPLDDGREWYRYHHLFSDYLQTELIKGQKAPLHIKASAWFQNNNMVEEAVAHALASEDFSRAACLIEISAVELFQRGALKTLLEWINCLPEDILSENYKLISFKTWVLFLTGDYPGAQNLLEVLDKTEFSAKPVNLGITLSLKLLFNAGGHYDDDAVKMAEQAVKLIGQSESVFRTGALLSLGQMYSARGQAGQAVRSFSEAYKSAQYNKNLFLTVISSINQALNLHWLGKRNEAMELCRRTIGSISNVNGQKSPLEKLIYLPMGMFYYESNELETAFTLFEEGLEFCKSRSFAQIVGYSIWHYILCKNALGDPEGAHNALKSMQEQTNDPGVLSLMEALDIELMIKEGKNGSLGGWTDKVMKDLILSGPVQMHLHLTYIHALIIQNRINEADTHLNILISAIENDGRYCYLADLYIFKALTLYYADNKNKAAEFLGKAVFIAAPEGFISAFLEKCRPISELFTEVSWIAPEFVQQIQNGLKSFGHKTAPGGIKKLPECNTIAEGLSSRELEILELAARGLSNKEIAEKLYISLGTTKWHINNIFGKLGVNNRTSAIEKGRIAGLIT